MNSIQYIESGMLELYVLDKLSPLEKVEVENMASRFPEVASEIKAIQSAFEKEAMENALEPSAHLESKIFNSLSFQSVEFEKDSLTAHSSANLISLKTYQLSLAACIILLLISAVSLWNLHNQLDETQKKYLAAITDTKKYASEARFLENENKRTQNALADSNTVTMRLKGIKTYSGMNAMVFWNKKEHSVVLSSQALPENDSSHSYQLWAIVNGKPVNGGIFDVHKGIASLNSMKTQSEAQAFAITLEPRGGSLNPHLEQLVSLATI